MDWEQESSAPVTVRLTKHTEKALKALMERTGYRRADTINRAIQLYNMINQMPVGTTLTVHQKDINDTPYITHRTIRRSRPHHRRSL